MEAAAYFQPYPWEVYDAGLRALGQLNKQSMLIPSAGQVIHPTHCPSGQPFPPPGQPSASPDQLWEPPEHPAQPPGALPDRNPRKRTGGQQWQQWQQ
jgi:hypothetical protein